MKKTTDPEHIAISKSKGIQIDWADGHQSNYTLDYLRARCPCASCTGAHGEKPAKGQSPFQMYQRTLRMDGVEPVGHYAIKIRWSDGHETGIYTFEYFRAICPCEVCRLLQPDVRQG